jgi:hypothetical protein
MTSVCQHSPHLTLPQRKFEYNWPIILVKNWPSIYSKKKLAKFFSGQVIQCNFHGSIQCLYIWAIFLQKYNYYFYYFFLKKYFLTNIRWRGCQINEILFGQNCSKKIDVLKFYIKQINKILNIWSNRSEKI